MSDPVLDLLSSVSTRHLAIDENAVYAAGRRRVRRRHVSQVAGSGVLALAVGSGTWLAASTLRPADSPATLSDRGASASTQQTKTAASANFRVDYVPTSEDSGRLRVHGRAPDGTWEVLADSAVEGPATHPEVLPVLRAGATVMTLPEDAYGIAAHVDLGGAGATAELVSPPAGSGRSIYVQLSDSGSDLAAPVVVWADTARTVRDVAGAPVPSVVIPERNETWFVLEGGRYWGSLADPWADHGSPSSTSPNQRMTLHSADTTGTGVPAQLSAWDGEQKTSFTALVPLRRRDVRVELADGIRLLSPVRTVPIRGSDRAVVLATISQPTRSTDATGTSRLEPDVTGVSWLEGERRVTMPLAADD